MRFHKNFYHNNDRRSLAISTDINNRTTSHAIKHTSNEGKNLPVCNAVREAVALVKAHAGQEFTTEYIEQFVNAISEIKNNELNARELREIEAHLITTLVTLSKYKSCENLAILINERRFRKWVNQFHTLPSLLTRTTPERIRQVLRYVADHYDAESFTQKERTFMDSKLIKNFK